jgi:hypothetical protein
VDELDDDVQSPVGGRREILRTAASAAGLLSLAGFGRAKPLAALGAAAPRLVLPRTQKVCVITPSQGVGPYYLNLNLLRSDITEGLPGLVTKFFVDVISASRHTKRARARHGSPGLGQPALGDSVGAPVCLDDAEGVP